MSKTAKYSIRVNSDVLHSLLQQVAERAYKAGYDDAKEQKEEDPAKVRIDPSLLRKLV